MNAKQLIYAIISIVIVLLIAIGMFLYLPNPFM